MAPPAPLDPPLVSGYMGRDRSEVSLKLAPGGRRGTNARLGHACLWTHDGPFGKLPDDANHLAIQSPHLCSSFILQRKPVETCAYFFNHKTYCVLPRTGFISKWWTKFLRPASVFNPPTSLAVTSLSLHSPPSRTCIKHTQPTPGRASNESAPSQNDERNSGMENVGRQMTDLIPMLR